MESLSTRAPWDMVAEGYAETTMKLFSSYIERALDLLEVHEGTHVADIACGPGTLSFAAARRGATVEALDFSPEMIRVLNAALADEGIAGVTAREGDGQYLPYDDATFDAAFSIDVLSRPGARSCGTRAGPEARGSGLCVQLGACRSVIPDGRALFRASGDQSGSAVA